MKSTHPPSVGSCPHLLYTGSTIQDETREFRALRQRLFSKYSPSTLLQQTALEIVAHCVWRCNFLIRLEKKNVALLSKEIVQAEDAAATGSKMHCWYLANPQELRNAITFLLNCKKVFEELQRIPEELKDGLKRGFGEEFLATVTQWVPPNPGAAQLAHHLVEHARTFRNPLPDKFKDQCHVVLDPFQSQQMVSKLFDERIQHLRDLIQIYHLKISDGGNSCGVGMGDSFGAATRDLQRAVGWFLWLKRNKL